MHVRPARDEDVPRLAELLAALFTQEKEFAPHAAQQAQGLRAILTQPAAGRILVLEEAGIIFGMANLLFTVSTFLGARVALLEDVVVDPAQRGKGHGTRLLQAAVDEARQAGCRRITLLTDRENLEAQAFYQRAGFVPSAMIPMRLMLEL